MSTLLLRIFAYEFFSDQTTGIPLKTWWHIKTVTETKTSAISYTQRFYILYMWLQLQFFVHFIYV